MLTAFRRIYATFPISKIALLPLLIADISISSISATLVLMLLHFIASLGKSSFPCEPAAGILPAASGSRL